ncbi:MAG: molecular chaperone of family [Schlesneria sp.]|nr:molecular chaperone of family [Schlesneria sp.]
MSQSLRQIDATPSKRTYRSIIADYGLETAICELIDNAIDSWISPRKHHSLHIDVKIDVDQQAIVISDNSGGVKESELRKLISPGESSTTGDSTTIGVFGVGSKRAVVALAQHVQITTRFQTQGTYRLVYDDEWLTSESWDLPYTIVADKLPPSTTEIHLSRLRFRIDGLDLGRLQKHLSMTYAHFVEDRGIVLQLNSGAIMAHTFDTWAYPPGCAPTQFSKTLSLENTGGKIHFEITGGLICERDSDASEYGVYIYCNGRLIARAAKDAELGYMSGLAGVPHHRSSLARVIVSLTGPSKDMPWNSSKNRINFNHVVFQAIKGDIIQVVKNYAAISRRLAADFESAVQPYATGAIVAEHLAKTESIKPSRLPDIPKSRKNFKDAVFELNEKVAEEKPWVRGLYEAVVAEEILAKQKHFEQSNRLSLIILDSTVEIALKDYLANEISQPMSDDRLANLFKNRVDVHKEAEKHLQFDPAYWKKMGYFYKLRCDLIHKRAASGISDADIDSYRRVVRRLLREAFKLRFPR